MKGRHWHIHQLFHHLRSRENSTKRSVLAGDLGHCDLLLRVVRESPCSTIRCKIRSCTPPSTTTPPRTQPSLLAPLSSSHLDGGGRLLLLMHNHCRSAKTAGTCTARSQGRRPPRDSTVFCSLHCVYQPGASTRVSVTGKGDSFHDLLQDLWHGREHNATAAATRLTNPRVLTRSYTVSSPQYGCI